MEGEVGETHPSDGPRRVDRDRVRVLHDDVPASGVLGPEVVLTVEHERDRVVAVERVDEVVRDGRRVERIGGTVRLISGIP